MRLLAALAILMATLGDLGMALTLKPLQQAGLLAKVTAPGVWVSMTILIAHFLLWARILARLELSVAQPFTALYYFYNALLVGPILHEVVPPQRWFGIALIAVGVVLVSQGTALEKATLDE